jgi:ABC-type sugar transport system ATPase subunit
MTDAPPTGVGTERGAPGGGEGGAARGPRLVASHVSKRFGITRALDDVSVSFEPGEVHALMGENGAGKSTLGKVIAGLHRADGGEVRLGERVLRPGDLRDAFDAGVRIVHQELAQCPNLSVAENLCLHDLPRTKYGLVDFAAAEARAARLVHALEPSIDVTRPLGLLSPGHRQICQIAAALDDGAASPARVIVFDEPTSSLSMAETDRLLRIVRDLAARGLTIIYVSHRMAEIFEVCDRVSVLRDGKYVGTSVVREIDEPTLVEQMIGRKLEAAEARKARSADAPVVLRVRDVTWGSRVRGVSFEVRAGEILGIGGLVGAGRSELLDAIFGVARGAGGVVEVEGARVDRSSPRDAIRKGVGYVPEDRRRQGLFFDLGVGENILVPFMGRLAGLLGVRSAAREAGLVEERMREYRVKAASTRSGPGELSGGNQQKLLIARWMGPTTKVVLLDEPTRGIDVGTKAEVYKHVRAAADRGAAVVLVSSEMPELLALSDRVLVMCAGRVTGELRGDEMTQANILRLATRENGAGNTGAAQG